MLEYNIVILAWAEKGTVRFLNVLVRLGPGPEQTHQTIRQMSVLQSHLKNH